MALVSGVSSGKPPMHRPSIRTSTESPTPCKGEDTPILDCTVADGLDTLAVQLEFFLQDAQAANRAPGTVVFYQQKLVPFLDHLRDQGIDRPEYLEPAHIRRFMSALTDGHSPGGCHAYWRAIRAFVRFLLREEVLQ